MLLWIGSNTLIYQPDTVLSFQGKMIRGIVFRSSHNRDSNPSARSLHSSSNHSVTSFLAAALFPHRTSSPHDQKRVDLHFLLHSNQSLSGRTPDGTSSRHGFPRKSHVFDDVIRPPHHVHSLTTVGVMTGVIVFLTIGATATLALFCCRKSFRSTVAKDDDQPDDVDDCRMDDIDVIFDDDDVIPLFLSSDSSHVTRTRLELRNMDEYEQEVTFDGDRQRQGFKSLASHPSHPSHRPTWKRKCVPRGLEVMTPEPINDSYEISDSDVVTFRRPSMTSEKLPEDNDVAWRASSEATGYPALAEGCRDGYRRIETEENADEDNDDEEEEYEQENVGAMETSLEDNNSINAEYESAEYD